MFEHLAHMHAHLPPLADGFDPLAWAGFGFIFTYSLMASLHCGAMCGPVVCALMTKVPSPTWLGISLYNIGRGASYMTAGALLGTFGENVLNASELIGRPLAVVLGVFLLVCSALSFGFLGPSWATWWGSLSVRMLRPLVVRLHSFPPVLAMFGLGMMTVFLPCMTLMPVFGLAAASGSTLNGAAFATAFYLGTLPIMVIAPIMPKRFAAVRGKKFAGKLAGFFLFLGGIMTLLRIFH